MRDPSSCPPLAAGASLRNLGLILLQSSVQPISWSRSAEMILQSAAVTKALATHAMWRPLSIF